jgi:hypothetical protein
VLDAGIKDAILRRTKRLPNGCRVWTGAHDQKGYGQIRRDGRVYRVHRVIYAAKHGAIPDGTLICHECDNPPCVEEDHLFAGTSKDNTLDMTLKARDRGRFKPGLVPTTRKLSVADVETIRTEYAAGRATQVELARRYRTRQGHISNIITRRAWRAS